MKRFAKDKEIGKETIDIKHVSQEEIEDLL